MRKKTKLSEKEKLVKSIREGFEKLAFGNISDVIKLLSFDKLDLDVLENMNFFNISEIKKLKDGGMEIKIFDRFKAMEKLLILSEKQGEDNSSLLSALVESSKVISACEKSE